MQVYKIYPRGFASNGYLVTQDGVHAIAIDPSGEWVLEEAKKRRLKVEYVLLTHGHFDHLGGVARLQALGAKVGCFQAEKQLIFSPEFLYLARSARMEFAPFSIDFTVTDGEKITLRGVEIQAIATAGHTAGSGCFLMEKTLFTGDTLFYGSVGRCDLPTGSFSTLEQSVKKLYALDGDYVVCAGHGEDSTLDYERKFNGYVTV